MYKDFVRENQYTSMWVSDYNERKFTREHGRDLSCCIFFIVGRACCDWQVLSQLPLPKLQATAT